LNTESGFWVAPAGGCRRSRHLGCGSQGTLSGASACSGWIVRVKGTVTRQAGAGVDAVTPGSGWFLIRRVEPPSCRTHLRVLCLGIPQGGEW
jgi:hypothetical protein